MDNKRLTREFAIGIVELYSECLRHLYKEAKVKLPTGQFEPIIEAEKILKGLKKVYDKAHKNDANKD